MKIIKDKQIIDDTWLYCDTPTFPASVNIIVPLALWQSEKDNLTHRQSQLGLRMIASDAIESIKTDLKSFDLIEVYFDVFTDGRSFSLIKLIRDKFNYKGEIRASGYFLRDQVFYLNEVGVNSFNCATETNNEGILTSLQDFTVSYQRT